MLWAVVALRLICPVLPESGMSFIPSFDLEDDISFVSGMTYDNVVSDNVPDIYKTDTANDYNSTTENVYSTESKRTQILSVGSYVWCAGAVLMFGYSICTYVRMRFRFRDAVLFKHNIRQSEKVTSPFVMGVIRPQIYIPFNMDNRTRKQVVLHEQSHIKRLDHIWKPFGFALLSLHWFNPFMWVSYILFCRDVEVACDERVIKNYGIKMKKSYAMALLKCRSSSAVFSACPLAFGEVGVDVRIKKTLNYRKPGVVIAIVGVLITLLLSLCLLTNPVSAVSAEVTDNRAVYIETEPIFSSNPKHEVATAPVAVEPTEPVTEAIAVTTEPIIEQSYVNDTVDSYSEEIYYEDQSYDYDAEYTYSPSKFIELNIEPMTLAPAGTYNSTGSHASSLLSFNDPVLDNKFDPNEPIYAFESERIRDSMNDMNRVIGSKRYR